jgi:hypothetical protein
MTDYTLLTHCVFLVHLAARHIFIECIISRTVQQHAAGPSVMIMIIRRCRLLMYEYGGYYHTPTACRVWADGADCVCQGLCVAPPAHAHTLSYSPRPRLTHRVDDSCSTVYQIDIKGRVVTTNCACRLFDTLTSCSYLRLDVQMMNALFLRCVYTCELFVDTNSRTLLLQSTIHGHRTLTTTLKWTSHSPNVIGTMIMNL